jgi:hypothetical protein
VRSEASTRLRHAGMATEHERKRIPYPKSMFKKILFGIIGALIALFIFVAKVLLLTGLIGFQTVAVLVLGLMIIVSFICWKKFEKNELIRDVSFGALCGSLLYLVLIFLFKSLVFSLLGGITG